MEGTDLSKLLTGGAIGGVAIGLVAAMWGKLKASWHYVTGYLVQRACINGNMHAAFVSYLLDHCRKSNVYDRVYAASVEPMRAGHHDMVAFESLGERPMLLWRGWWPIFYSPPEEAKKAESSKRESRNASIAFLRGSINIEQLITESIKHTNDMMATNRNNEAKLYKRFFIKRIPESRVGDGNVSQEAAGGLAWYQYSFNRLVSHQVNELGRQTTFEGRALDNLFFPAEIEKLQHEILLWREHRQWYRNKGLPWKRGWLLYGPPGTGKTALARAFAEDLDIPVFVYSLAEMTNADLRRQWSKMVSYTPCIALIEDIDGVFHGRENIAARGRMSMMFGPMMDYSLDDKLDASAAGGAPPLGNSDTPPQKEKSSYSPLTFDCLLNVIDGVERMDGVFTIITTNDITKVDEAIGQPVQGSSDSESTRPGRIDRVIELTYMTVPDQKRMAERILKEYPEQLHKLLGTIDATKQVTPSQFQERCAQVALAVLWEQTRHDLAQLR